MTEADVIFVHINDVRRRFGKELFTVDPRLTEAAQKHADWMERNNRMAHNYGWFWSRSTPQTRARAAGFMTPVAENIAWASYQRAVPIWSISSGHLRNMTGNYSRVGIGVSTASSGGNAYICALFG
jgi:uncharacterized protein YkwD